MTEHTPGPWGLETVITQCGVCHKIGPWPHKWSAGVTMSACIYDDYPSQMPQGTDVMIANARLIAASPDLLAVAESVVAWADHQALLFGAQEPLSFVDAARAAIAKAKGVSL